MKLLEFPILTSPICPIPFSHLKELYRPTLSHKRTINAAVLETKRRLMKEYLVGRLLALLPVPIPHTLIISLTKPYTSLRLSCTSLGATLTKEAANSPLSCQFASKSRSFSSISAIKST